MEQTAIVNISVNGKEAENKIDSLRKKVITLSKAFLEAQNNLDFSKSNSTLKEINNVIAEIEREETLLNGLNTSIYNAFSNDKSFLDKLQSRFKRIFSSFSSEYNSFVTDFERGVNDFINGQAPLLSYDDIINESKSDVNTLSSIEQEASKINNKIIELLEKGKSLLKTGYSPQLLNIHNELIELTKDLIKLKPLLNDSDLNNLITSTNREAIQFDKQLISSRNLFRNSSGNTELQQLYSEINEEQRDYYIHLNDLIESFSSSNENYYDKQRVRQELLLDHLHTLLNIYEANGLKGSKDWSRVNLQITQTEQKIKRTEFLSRKTKLDDSRSNSLLNNELELQNNLISYQEFINRKHSILQDYYKNAKSLFEEYRMTETRGYAKLLDDELTHYRVFQQQISGSKKSDLLKSKEKEQQEIVKLYYTKGSEIYRNEQLLRIKLAELDVAYTEKEVGIYKEGTYSWNRAKQSLITKQREQERREEELYSSKLSEWRKNQLIDDTEERLNIELSILQSMFKKKLIDEEEYEKLRHELIKRYRSEHIDYLFNSDYHDNGFGDKLRNLSKAFEELCFNSSNFQDILENIGKTGELALSVANSFMTASSNYMKACEQLALAKIDQKYKKQLENARYNSKRLQRIEEQKEKEIAKIKNKYNNKQMKVEVAQAIASTSLAAINAFASASKVNWLLGAVAAAAALTFGGLQIAIIRKQHEAQSLGYYEGGFTLRHYDNRREVGIVHANEFVANHDAVSNPNLLPLFRMIDIAQKNNTVGSLTASDVSRSIGHNARTSLLLGDNKSAYLSMISSYITGNTAVLANAVDVLDALKSVLSNGIESYMVMDGERGFDRFWQNYQKLKNNPKR